MKLTLKNVFLSIGAVLFSLALFAVVGVSSASAADTCTASTGNWNVTGTWSGCTTGGAHVPTSADTVIIPTNVTVTVTSANDVNTPAVAATVTLQDPVNSSNALTINSGAYIQITGALTLAGSSGSGNSTVTNTLGSINTGSLAIAGGGSTGNSVVTSNSILTVNGNITFTGTPATAQLTTTSSGYVTMNGGTMSAGGTVSMSSGSGFFTTGISAVNGAYTFGMVEPTSGTLTLGAALIAATGLQIDSGATLAAGANLVTDSCTSTGVNGFTINGTLSGTGGITLGGAGCTIDGTGTISNNGTLTLTNAKTIASTAVLTLPGTVAISAATTVTNNGTVTTTGASGITGANGSTSIWTNAANSTLNFGGATTSLLSTGVLTASASGNTVNYNLAGIQTVKVPATSYYNLTFGGTGAKSIASGLTIVNAFTIGVGTSAALTGASTADTYYVGNALEPKGSWGATGSGATHISDTYFTGAGAGTVTAASGRTSGSYSGDIDSTSDTGGSRIGSSSTDTTSSTYLNQPSSTTTTVDTTTTTPVVPTLIVTAVPAGCETGSAFNTLNGQACASAGATVWTPPAPTSYNFGFVTLKNGSRGDAVMELQRFLNAKLSLGLVVDGKLGPKTIAVIKKWQKDNGLVADGLIGTKTKLKMNASVASQ